MRSRPEATRPVTLLLGVDQQASACCTPSQPHPVNYTPYGHHASADARHQLGFIGQVRDPLTAGYPLGNGYRSYNPHLTRFHSPDHLSPFNAGGLNAYGYCSGDPINRSDPSGHMWRRGSAKLSTVPGQITVERYTPMPDGQRDPLLPTYEKWMDIHPERMNSVTAEMLANEARITKLQNEITALQSAIQVAQSNPRLASAIPRYQRRILKRQQTITTIRHERLMLEESLQSLPSSRALQEYAALGGPALNPPPPSYRVEDEMNSIRRTTRL